MPRSRSSSDDSQWGPGNKINDEVAYSQPLCKRWSNPGVLAGIPGLFRAVVWFVWGILLIDRLFIDQRIMFTLSGLSFLQGLGLIGTAKDH